MKEKQRAQMHLKRIASDACSGDTGEAYVIKRH